MSAPGDSYDPVALEAAARMRPRTFEDRLDKFARLDPHFAKVWSTYTGRLFARPALDLRTRLLVLAGQYTMLGNASGLADTLAAAMAEGVDAKEVLEAILQCWVYAGEQAVSDAVDVFTEVVGEAGRLDEVEARGLPADAGVAGRSLDDERRTWHPDDAEDPLLERLLERYGWHSVSAGLRLRPRTLIDTLAALSAVDEEFAGLWLDGIYGGMYVRGVLDDRTRLLCMVGDCVAVGETYQAPRHMRGALRQGATPAEVFEVLFQSCSVVGHPVIIGIAVNDLVQVLEDEGRLAEFVDEANIDVLRRVVAARIARRHTVAELKATDGQAEGTGHG